MTTITLQQFEQIDGLFNACRYRPDLEQVMAHPLASRDYVSNVYFRPEWELEDACVEVMGLEFVQGHASAVDAAAEILTRALTSSTFVQEAA